MVGTEAHCRVDVNFSPYSLLVRMVASMLRGLIAPVAALVGASALLGYLASCSADKQVPPEAPVASKSQSADGEPEAETSEADKAPKVAKLEKIVPNSNYFGVVTGVKDRVFFVRLQAGVNAKTKLYRSIDMPSRLDTVSFRVTRVDEENGIALGFITRIIKRHTRLR